MEDRTGDDPRGIVCDLCGSTEALGAFFVPGKGVLNLCGRCRIMPLAILIDVM